MRNLRGLSVMAVACVLGLSLMGLATSQATAVQSSSVVVLDASTELALLDMGELDVLSVNCPAKCLTDNANCLESNCGTSTSPNCCCKFCNGALDCYRKNQVPGFCVAQ
jgi:hypothetical protein